MLLLFWCGLKIRNIVCPTLSQNIILLSQFRYLIVQCYWKILHQPNTFHSVDNKKAFLFSSWTIMLNIIICSPPYLGIAASIWCFTTVHYSKAWWHNTGPGWRWWGWLLPHSSVSGLRNPAKWCLNISGTNNSNNNTVPSSDKTEDYPDSAIVHS